MKVWITKYALTKGIEQKEVKISNSNNDLVTVLDNAIEIYIGEGKEWHRTKEEALKKAEEMRLKKIASAEKQLKKLKELKFK